LSQQLPYNCLLDGNILYLGLFLDIAQNCSIEFIDDIIPVQYPSSVRNENDSNIIEAEIKNLLDKKVISNWNRIVRMT
jgi:hypothetical protein